MINFYAYLDTISQLMIISMLSCIITQLFKKRVLTNKFIHQIFNIICAIVITFILDTIQLIHFRQKITVDIIFQELVLMITAAFLSQSFYKWIKDIKNNFMES